MLLLRDHYRAAVDEKVGALLLLLDPIWRPNFAVALAWAQRHFGERLRLETVYALRSRLREELDTPFLPFLEPCCRASPSLLDHRHLPPASGSLGPVWRPLTCQ